jgi:hypothetical protein
MQQTQPAIVGVTDSHAAAFRGACGGERQNIKGLSECGVTGNSIAEAAAGAIAGASNSLHPGRREEHIIQQTQPAVARVSQQNAAIGHQCQTGRQPE